MDLTKHGLQVVYSTVVCSTTSQN